MSCVGFWTESQRERLRAAALCSRSVSRFLSPRVTEGKVPRLRLMAADPSPAMRESAALNVATPDDVLELLAADAHPAVRGCVARHRRCPEDVLRRLSRDGDEVVRGWVASNPTAPDDVVAALAVDPSATVRRLARWAHPAPVEDQ